MTQGTLFPLRVKHHLPPAGRGKDVRFFALADDGMEWALKRQAEHTMLPASEYFGYQLAQACSLATPYCGILADLDGALVFGSRIEAGLTDLATEPQANVPARIASCAGRMSGAYALDLFMGNNDRHFGNFLYRAQSDGRLAAMVIDWSRAWWVGGWPPQDLTTAASATSNHVHILRALKLWSPTDALLTLGTVSSVPVSAVKDWLDKMPASWLTPADRGTLLAWWGSPAFQSRISACVSYCR